MSAARVASVRSACVGIDADPSVRNAHTYIQPVCMLPGMPETTLQLSQGPVRVRTTGDDGPPIVFIHGLLVDGRLWDDVVTPLSEHARCFVPDLPLGAHRAAMHPDADLTPYGLARLIADVLEALGLQDVTLVANDTGGALSQLVVTRHPARGAP